MATLAIQSAVRAGVAPSYAAAAGGGDAFLPSNYTWLHIKNGGGSPITVTVVTPRTDPIGNAVADVAVSVPATTGERVIGPFPAEFFADPSTGLASITYSGVTTVTIGAFALSQP